MCEEKRDYSLLRKFDFKNATIGDKVCWHNGDTGVYYGIDSENTICINWKDVSPKRFMLYEEHEHKKFYQPPLCWVEGKPVYRGDKLYIKDINLVDIVTGSLDDLLAFQNSGACYKDNRNGNLTWTPRKVKKTGWINIYPDGAVSPRYHKTEQLALAHRKYGTLGLGTSTALTIKIEWEE